MPSDYDSFKINSAKDLNVSDFFEVTEFPQWSFQNFYDYILEEDHKININTAKRLFSFDIDRLMKSDHLPDQLKSSLGHLVKKEIYLYVFLSNSVLVFNFHRK